MDQFPQIAGEINPYRVNVQGKANEPICVAGYLDFAYQLVGASIDGLQPDWSLSEIYDRLERNAPRVAVIGGSPDHPAHLYDQTSAARAALRIWQLGGVPFQFSVPVMCDGTAQSNIGMCYSLQSREAITQMVVNQLESHSYHGAVVLQSCDKQPLAMVAALAHVDRLRRRRGEAPFFATFIPSHVLKGGTLPPKLVQELEEVAEKARQSGAVDIAEDLEDTMRYILQCATNTSYQGVIGRAVRRGLITPERHKELEKQLAVHTCDPAGGICAFNGTGNSSRILTCALGLVHPAVSLLTAPPSQTEINKAVDALARLINRPKLGVASIIAANVRNAIRIYSSAGGSTNLTMHLTAAMLYAGYRFSLDDLDEIHHSFPIPDLFDYSLTEDRDIFRLAEQFQAGRHRGVETLFYELVKNGVPMDESALTVTGTSWAERLKAAGNLGADHVAENPIILSRPRRPFSGVDKLTGNFFESAVVKISGMPTSQLDQFDNQAALVIYYPNEEEANQALLDPDILEELRRSRAFAEEDLRALARHNGMPGKEWCELNYDQLFAAMVDHGSLKLAVIIAGQGPAAFGMPEMFTPMQHINANRQLQRLVTLISDGRYSGVTRGAAIGHMTPEAIADGGILYLKTGDVLFLGLRRRQIELLDRRQLRQGNIVPADLAELKNERRNCARARLEALKARRQQIAASNRFLYHTDAARGVVPQVVYTEAELDYRSEIPGHGGQS